MLSETRFETIAVAELRRMGIVSDRSTEPRVVLIVDGDRIITDTRVEILNQWGYAAFAAYDAESALDIARISPPAIFICDLELPRVNGAALAMEIRLLAPACKVILISGLAANPEMIAVAEREGFEVNMGRPLHPAGLSTLLDSL